MANTEGEDEEEECVVMVGGARVDTLLLPRCTWELVSTSAPGTGKCRNNC